MSEEARNLSQDNIMRKVYDSTLEALKVTGSISVAPTPGAATSAKQDVGNASLSSIDSKLTNPLPVSGSLVISPLKVFYSLPLLSVNSNNIPASSSLPLELISSTSQATKEIQVIEDIGEFMALYTGAVSSEALLCSLPLGGGNVQVNVPANTRISIKSLKNITISAVSYLTLNLLN